MAKANQARNYSTDVKIALIKAAPKIMRQVNVFIGLCFASDVEAARVIIDIISLQTTI
ncbi:hypothetical protein KO527_15630 [Pseudoalteromonas sp. C2R02]|uniref:hypothetical protein n=1 Tax=Pseudoalteromonas sp. C2R02 TaxID=2841565 RepID=UPI001C09A8A6|nr:hypothetical protein [Pseudoalteromonas sp. C2R02]MBU2970782.1 hypothetical protein [Pseudoalteromonas sp. C2R02]